MDTVCVYVCVCVCLDTWFCVWMQCVCDSEDHHSASAPVLNKFFFLIVYCIGGWEGEGSHPHFTAFLLQ